MALTNFIPRQTLITAAWLNEVDLFVQTQNAIKLFDTSYGVSSASSDNTEAYNNLIAAINATVGPVVVQLSPGTFTILDSLNAISRSNVSFIGDQTILDFKNTSSAGFTIFNPLGKSENFWFHNLTFTSSVSKVGGYGIKLLNVENIRFTSCNIKNQYIGVDIATYQYIYFSNCIFDGNTIAAQTYFGDGFFVDNSRVKSSASSGFAAGTIGFSFLRGGGFQISNTDFTRLAYGISILPTGGDPVGYVFLSTVSLDTCDIGFFADATNGQVYHIQSDDSCWFTSNTTNGIKLVSVKIATIKGTIALNGSTGAVVSSCRLVKFSNAFIGFNNVANSALIAGVTFTDTVGFEVENCNVFNENAFYGIGTYNQKIGVKLGSGCEDGKIINNRFANHANGDIDIAVAPTKLIIKGNTTDVSNVIASATTITVPVVMDIVYITGTTTVANINIVKIPGKELKLITEAACTITSTFNFKLAGASNFVGTAGSCLSLITDRSAAQLTEVSRAIL